jgi:serine/threonine protein kinase
VRIGPYEVVHELGRGGMAVVYAARHPNDPRPLAIKLLKRVSNARTLTRFAREAATMAKVSHPHVIRIVDVGETPQGPYIVLEQIQGQSLEDRLRIAPLEPRQAAEICAQLAAGVGALHGAGVIHRDLKPDNVMLRSDGSAVVLDLGLAHEESAESLTRTGQLVGTPAYMSPEQAAGQHRDIDERSDVYALGATLFAAVSGEAPFTGDTLIAVACAVLEGEVEWPPEVPPALEAIGRKAMAKSPSERHPNAAALERELRSYLAGRTPPSPPRPPLQFVLLGLLVFVGVSLAAVALTPRREPGLELPSPTAEVPTLPPSADPSPTQEAPPGNPVREAAALRSLAEGLRLQRTRAWLQRYPKHRLAPQIRRSFLSLKLAQGPHEVLAAGTDARARFALGPQGGLTGYRFVLTEDERKTEFLRRQEPGGRLQVIGELAGDVGCDVIYRPGSSLVGLGGGGSRPLRLVDPEGRLRFLGRANTKLSMWNMAATKEHLAVTGFDYAADSARLSVYRWTDLIESSEVPPPVATTTTRGVAYRVLRFLPDGSLVGVGKPDDTLYRWQIREESLVALERLIVPQQIATFAAHPHRPWLAVALKTFQLQIMEAASGSVLCRLQAAAPPGDADEFVSVAQAHNSYPTSAVFSPEGDRLFSTASGPGSSELRVWNTSGQPAAHHEYASVVRPGGGSRFYRSRISPDGRWLLTVSRYPPRPGQKPIRKPREGEPKEYFWDTLVEIWDVGEQP